MEKLSEVVLDFVISRGACAAGIVTTRTLEGGPPSTDLSYVLPNAHSAISFAVPVDQDLIQPYFMKQDHLDLEHATYQAYTLSSGISLELATYLEMKGIPSLSFSDRCESSYYLCPLPVHMLSGQKRAQAAL